MKRIKTSSASVGDALRVTIVRETCGKACPVERLAALDDSAGALHVGDTVLCHGKPLIIEEITTGSNGKTGVFVVCGRRQQLAAALLLFTEGSTHFVDKDIEKICPKCGRTVMRFR